MKTIFTTWLLFSFLCMRAQETEWASKVEDHSSELSPVQHSARQVLGAPDVLPMGTFSPNAWTPTARNKQFIKVGFSQPKKISQVAILESYNPGRVHQVFLYDRHGREHLVYTFSPRHISKPGRIIHIFFDLTPYEVKSVKVTTDSKGLSGYHSIDAIGISASLLPITIGVDLAGNLRADLRAEALSADVNSRYAEISPLISPNGKTLYFGRQDHPGNMGGEQDREDIWYSSLDEHTGTWTPAQNLGAPLNNEGPNFINSIHAEGEGEVFLMGNRYEGAKMSMGVSMVSKNKDLWSKPTNLSIQNDYNLSDKANYFLAASNKTLLMSVERHDSQGDRDLYASFMLHDGSWSAPTPLGTAVNSADEESAPFLSADDKTLFFSSRGHKGYGGKDIYMTRRLDDTWRHWSEPENLGPAINSANDEEFFNVPLSGSHAYYSREVEKGNTDVFRVKLPLFMEPEPVVVIAGHVYDAKTNAPVDATIRYEKLPEGTEAGIARTQAGSGAYQIALPYGSLYGYRAEEDGYLSLNANIDLKTPAAYRELKEDLYLVPAEKDASLVLNNIFFDFGKAALREASFAELKRVAAYLAGHPSVKILVTGHTDNVGNPAYNLKLSGQRVNAVRDYLLASGAQPAQVETQARGDRQPLAPNEAAAGRDLNRRVEFRILQQ